MGCVVTGQFGAILGHLEEEQRRCLLDVSHRMVQRSQSFWTT